MPLPLGHSAIGFSIHTVMSDNKNRFSNWKLALLIIFLSNLPDIDVLVGLILHNNGSVYHRGPTHSILFAIIMGIVACKSSKLSLKIPTISLKTSFCVIFSHIAADYLFTNSLVSFFWPFDVSWSTGNSGWGQVLQTVFLDATEDTGILIACICFIIATLILERTYLFQRPKWSVFRIFSSQKQR